jgi:NAD(P)-dependent dehydrogenase (short-subunit alcohol dehydrogenase family)
MGTYLITGATRGIGRALVDELAAEDLILAARDGAALDELCGSLRSARAMRVDLAQPESIAAAVRDAGLPDRLDGVVHSAGILRPGRLADLEPAVWAEQLTVNVTAVAELTRLVLPALRAARGTALFVNSGAGRRVSGPGNGGYAASKHALTALADSLRFEEPDVRVTTVFCGRTATDMQRELRSHEGGDYRPEEYLRPETVAGFIAHTLRLPADARIDDVRLAPRG